jgi:hypothetical protein
MRLASVYATKPTAWTGRLGNSRHTFRIRNRMLHGGRGFGGRLCLAKS